VTDSPRRRNVVYLAYLRAVCGEPFKLGGRVARISTLRRGAAKSLRRRSRSDGRKRRAKPKVSGITPSRTERRSSCTKAPSVDFLREPRTVLSRAGWLQATEGSRLRAIGADSEARSWRALAGDPCEDRLRAQRLKRHEVYLPGPRWAVEYEPREDRVNDISQSSGAHEALLNRKHSEKSASEIFGDGLTVLRELIDEATHLQVRALKTSARETPDVVLLGILLPRAIKLLDSLDLLASSGQAYGARVLLRALLEGAWGLEMDASSRHREARSPVLRNGIEGQSCRE
jgi:hypothetical protein